MTHSHKQTPMPTKKVAKKKAVSVVNVKAARRVRPQIGLKVAPPTNLPVLSVASVAPSVSFPNTTPISMPLEMAIDQQISHKMADLPVAKEVSRMAAAKTEVTESNSIIKSARAAFYLGMISGVVIMSLLVVIAYYAAVTDSYYLSQAYPAGPTRIIR